MKSSDTLTSLPKIELHEHLDGSLRPDTVLDLARVNGVRLPSADRKELVRILSPGPSSLEVYLQAFATTVAVLQTAEALRRVALETVEDWHRDGIVYGEVRFAPELHLAGGLPMEIVVESVLRGLEDGRRQFPVETGLILCSMRHAPPTLRTAKLVKDYRNDGVVAFDLAGSEAPFPPSLHREAFEYCAENLLAATCHAGEVTGPEYIRDAHVACRSLRIGHGTQLIQEWNGADAPMEAASLTRWIHDRQIPLELCLTSNIQTKACEDLRSHPFEAFRTAGLRVTLNTDNRLVSSTNLTQELRLARDTWGLSDSQLFDLEVNALESAFCTPATKKRIRTKYFS